MTSENEPQPTETPRKWQYLQIAAVAAIIVIVLCVVFPGVTGFAGKTLWDWLELLIIPAVLAVGAWYLNRAERKAERDAMEQRAGVDRELAAARVEEDRKIAENKLQDEIVRGYLDNLSDLILEHKLLEKASKARMDFSAFQVAQARTVTTLRQLNTLERKNIILQFLRDTDLASFVLENASLQGIDLHHTNMTKLNLHGAHLESADLWEANLDGANLSAAHLEGASLMKAQMKGANLRDTNLEGANLWNANPWGAEYNAATRWPDRFDPAAASMQLVK